MFFQLAAATVLLFRRAEPRLPVRILGVMLLLNAGVTAILFHVFWPPVDEGRRIAAALDAPTEMLMFAFLASLSQARWARQATWAFIGLAGVMGAVAPLAYQHPPTGLSTGFEMLRGALFFIGLALVCFRLAGGAETWERWAALAFLPRALYWATVGGSSVYDVLAGTALPKDTLLLLTVPFLAAVSLAGMARLLRRPRPPSRIAAVVIPVTGVAIALSEWGIRQVQEVDPVLIPALSFITLGVHRPLFLLVGLAPALLPSAVKRSLLAAAAGGAGLIGLGALYPQVPAAAVLFGFVVGAMALAVMEVLRPRLEQPPVVEGRALSPTAPEPGPAPPPALDRPQWQALVLALRGSCLKEGEAPRGEAGLRQKALVEATGIPAPRVSTIVRELNETAAVRLDSYAPGWRDLGPVPLEPQLVQQYRGHVPGTPGVWVYYRLTPQGEYLARTLRSLPAGAPAGSGRAEPAL